MRGRGRRALFDFAMVLHGLTLALLSDWITTLSLVFGGCCRSCRFTRSVHRYLTVITHSNAITLEKITSGYPQSGTLITFFQFLVISFYGLPKHVTFHPPTAHSKSESHNRSWFNIPFPRLKPRKIPLAPYLTQVGLFYLISVINNAAFGYHVPMAVHIIFRSGGLIVSMLLGWFVAGKK
jgi:solute carrier family 35 (UDP-xylose/UDP-N-acetylglucosamine transporter), member B4